MGDGVMDIDDQFRRPRHPAGVSITGLVWELEERPPDDVDGPTATSRERA
jgi:hypothetical protein